MSVLKRESILPILLDSIMSAVKQSVIFETVSHTVGSQIRVSCQRSFATNFLIVKFQFGEMEVSHAISETTIHEAPSLSEIINEFCAVGQAFVADIVESFETFSFEDLTIYLWESAGIAIGGDW